jgi:hypothetical protein
LGRIKNKAAREFLKTMEQQFGSEGMRAAYDRLSKERALNSFLGPTKKMLERAAGEAAQAHTNFVAQVDRPNNEKLNAELRRREGESIATFFARTTEKVTSNKGTIDEKVVRKSKLFKHINAFVNAIHDYSATAKGMDPTSKALSETLYAIRLLDREALLKDSKVNDFWSAHVTTIMKELTNPSSLFVLPGQIITRMEMPAGQMADDLFAAKEALQKDDNGRAEKKFGTAQKAAQEYIATFEGRKKELKNLITAAQMLNKAIPTPLLDIYIAQMTRLEEAWNSTSGPLADGLEFARAVFDDPAKAIMGLDFPQG